MSQQSDPAKKTLHYGRYEIPVNRAGEPVELGRGGMGVTYKALDGKLDRLVVLKVVSNALHHNVQARQKFLREARLLAKLSHPNIAAVFDIGEQDGTDYYVMEYIEGEDLGARVHAMGAVPVGLALEITRQSAAALAAAWKHGLIHRDIKPANLMLAKSDGVVKVKLIDFGLAKAVGAAAQDMTRITLTGEMAGYSPAFASPEQIEGMEVDTRSDIYSLGVTMWYLMAGKPPFSGTSRRQVENAHINQPPPVHLIEGSIPKPVVKMLQHMLEKDPADRPENPAVLEEMLTDLVESTEVKAAYDTLAFGSDETPPKPVRGTRTRSTKTAPPAVAATTTGKRMNPLLIAGPVVLILGVALALIFSRSTQPEPTTPITKVVLVTPTPEPVLTGRAPGSTDAEFVNSLGMKFLPIPGTRVMFSVWETRVQDYEAFAKANPTYDAGAGWMDPYFEQGPTNPVVFVCYDDGVEFCKWLTEKERKEGKILPNQTYRLPTDDEWSAAAGLPSEPGDSPDLRDGRNKTLYPWPNGKWPPTQGKAGNYAESVKAMGDTFANTAPVGSFDPNFNGLYDMGGNAWEWVADWYENAKSGRQTNRTLRGGSWQDSRQTHLLSSARLYETHEVRNPAFGFRVVLTRATSR